MWCHEPDRIKEIVVSHFKALFSEVAQQEHHMGVLNDQFPMLTEESIHRLDAEY